MNRKVKEEVIPKVPHQEAEDFPLVGVRVNSGPLSCATPEWTLSDQRRTSSIRSDRAFMEAVTLL